MKKLIFVLMVLLMVLQVQAADTTNCAVSFEETAHGILYYGVAVFGVAGGTDNTTTQYMRIEGFDFENNLGNLQVYATNITGAEDYNGFIEFSNTTTAASFGALATDTNLDALAITVVTDTVGVAMAKKTYGHKYMRLKFDGQTGNPHELNVNWFIFLPKKSTTKRIGNVGSTS